MSLYYYNGVFYTEEELYHHGIKGQKWGVRRYQNEDGTRTAAGKKRYREDGRKLIYETRPQNHKTSLSDDNDETKKKKIEASVKEASETIKYYGGKNSAIREAKKEYDYAASKNRARLGVSETLSVGSAAAGYVLLQSAETTLMSILGATTLGAGAIAIPVLAIGAYQANKILTKNRNEKIDYILDSAENADTLRTNVNFDINKIYKR